MNKATRDDKHYVEIKRFGAISVVQDHNIEKVNHANNLSEKAIPSRPPRAAKFEHKQVVRENKKPEQTREPKPARDPLAASEPVKVNQLVLRNNQQSVIGKVLSVSEETRNDNKTNEEQVHIVGQIADETGAVHFDLLKNNNVSV